MINLGRETNDIADAGVRIFTCKDTCTDVDRMSEGISKSNFERFIKSLFGHIIDLCVPMREHNGLVHFLGVWPY